MQITGKVRGSSKYCSDGLESFKIEIPKKQANGFPYQDGGRVSVNLIIANNNYIASVRSTKRNKYVWICPNLSDKGNEKTNLTKVLKDNGIEKNETVALEYESEENMTVGEKVQLLSNKQEINQKQLAEASGLTGATISRIMRGQSKHLRLETLKMLALALNVSVDYLVARTTSITANDILNSDPIARDLFDSYLGLSATSRELLLEYVRLLEGRENKKKRKNYIDTHMDL
jgi:transcriptional regulator with XRE-family HTH domain